MAKTKKRRGSSDGDPFSISAGVIGRGTLRVGEGDALRVALLRVDGNLVVRSDMIEIGSWPIDDVEITSHRKTFEMAVDGEIVEFQPDDPRRVPPQLVGEAFVAVLARTQAEAAVSHRPRQRRRRRNE